jgi:hypothetical protein
MKIRPIVIAMVAWLVLPLAGANARAVSDPGLNQAGVPISSAAHTAENFGRIETEGNKDPKRHHCDDGNYSDRGHPGDDCEKSPSKPH